MKPILTVIVVVAAMLCAPGAARAHPCFVGTYSAPLPCGGAAIYEFFPGRFVGNGVWEGCLTFTAGGQPISTGWYQLRMWSATEGTVSIREGEGIGTAVGIVDLAERRVEYIGTVYRK